MALGTFTNQIERSTIVLCCTGAEEPSTNETALLITHLLIAEGPMNPKYIY